VHDGRIRGSCGADPRGGLRARSDPGTDGRVSGRPGAYPSATPGWGRARARSPAEGGVVNRHQHAWSLRGAVVVVLVVLCGAIGAVRSWADDRGWQQDGRHGDIRRFHEQDPRQWHSGHWVTSGMPGGWGGGGSSEGCGTSTRAGVPISGPYIPQRWRHRYRAVGPAQYWYYCARARRTTPMSRAVRKDGCRWSRRQRRPGREAEGGSRGGETPLRGTDGDPTERRLPRMSARREIVKYDGRRTEVSERRAETREILED